MEQKWYNKTWLVIVLCIFFFPVGLYALWKNDVIGLIWKIGGTVLIGAIIMANFSSKDETAGSATAPTTDAVAADASVEADTEETQQPQYAWVYSQDESAMDGRKRYFASCRSTNEIEFDFPYNGGSTFTLTLRNMGRGNEVILEVSKGQFMSSIASSETLRAKFDEDSPLTFSYNSADDGSTDIIFLNNAAKFISKLKKADKLMLEATFYNEGNRIIYFDVAGLKWDK